MVVLKKDATPAWCDLFSTHQWSLTVQYWQQVQPYEWCIKAFAVPYTPKPLANILLGVLSGARHAPHHLPPNRNPGQGFSALVDILMLPFNLRLHTPEQTIFPQSPVPALAKKMHN